MTIVTPARPWIQRDFNQTISDWGCVGFKDPPIKLKEPRFNEPVLSPFYVNMRNASETVDRLYDMSEYLASFCAENGINGEYFLGVPEGATKLGVVATIQYCDKNTRVPLSRSKPKEHGDPRDRNYVTPIEKDERPIIVEDVNTTGESLVREIKKALEVGAKPTAVTLVNRLEIRDDKKTITDVMKEMGIPYYYMTDAIQILTLEFAKLLPEKQKLFGSKVEAYYEKYGAIRITADDLKRKVA